MPRTGSMRAGLVPLPRTPSVREVWAGSPRLPSPAWQPRAFTCTQKSAIPHPAHPPHCPEEPMGPSSTDAHRPPRHLWAQQSLPGLDPSPHHLLGTQKRYREGVRPERGRDAGAQHNLPHTGHLACIYLRAILCTHQGGASAEGSGTHTRVETEVGEWAAGGSL